MNIDELIEEYLKEVPKKGEKNLAIDIETAPAEVAAFNVGECRLTHDMILEDASIFMVQWSWFGNKKIHTLDLTDFEGWQENWRDDSALVEVIGRLMNEADVITGQNSKRFDEKWLKSRALKYKLPPIEGYISHDTLISSRKHFKLMSHKLDYIAQYLGLEGKVETNWSWWKDLLVSARNQDWNRFQYRVNKFKKYGKKDVELLKKVYTKMIPYCPEWTQVYTVDGQPEKCTFCGGHLQKNGTRRTASNIYQRYVCMNCGRSARGYKGIIKSKNKLQ